MLLSLIIPTYNERENVAAVVERATAALKQQTERFEIIIVDDDSPDRTWQRAEELARDNPHVRVIRRQGERGLATAVVAGWNAARGEIIGVMDGDLQHPPEVLPALIQPIVSRRADIAIGSRNVEGGGTIGWDVRRRFLSRSVSWLAKLVLLGLLPRLRDPMSGFFLLRRSVIQGVCLVPRGYKILLEVLVKGNYRDIKEVPILFTERKQGKSKAGPKECWDSLIHFGHLRCAQPGRAASRSTYRSRKRADAAVNQSGFGLAALTSLAIVFVLGLANLPQPFWADQAHYTITAENLREGSRLYKDLWDVKQPGIFYFYLAGGSLFGFHEIGIHLFELLCMLIFSAVLLFTLKRRFTDPVLASLVPIFTVGVYYGITSGAHQTQPEALMGVPTFLSLWCAYRGMQARRRKLLWLFFSGIAGGVVLVLKLMFLPILMAFWTTALWRLWHSRAKASANTLLKSALAIGAGVHATLLLMVLHLASQGVLNIALWTFFVYPIEAVSAWPIGANLHTLTDSLLWFKRNFAPVLALSVIGAYSRLAARRDFLTLNLVLWVLAGSFVILLQRLSWFESHFMLLVVPLGILAARGVDELWAAWRRRAPFAIQRSRVVALASVMLLLLPIWTAPGMRSAVLAREQFAPLLIKEDLQRYQAAWNEDYRDALRETAFLREGTSAPGDIYVIGDAVYYYLSGRNPAIPILIRHFVPPSLWSELVGALHREKPARYIFIARNYPLSLRKYTPEAVPYIDAMENYVYTNYDVLRTSNAGTWYELRGQGAHSSSN